MNRESAAKKIQEAYRKKHSIRTNANFMRHVSKLYKHNYHDPNVNWKSKAYKKIQDYAGKIYGTRIATKDPIIRHIKKIMKEKYSGNINTIQKLQKAYRNKHYIKSNAEYVRKLQQYRNYLKQFEGVNDFNNNNMNNYHKLLSYKLHQYRWNHPKATTTYPTIWQLNKNIKTHAAKKIQASLPKIREYRQRRLNAFKKAMEPRTFNAGKVGKMALPNNIIKLILKNA
jgi:hypothetical protein